MVRVVFRTKLSRTFLNFSKGNTMQNTFRNFLLLVTVATAAMAVNSSARAATPEADFAARCAASGVLVCQAFDNASTFVYSPSQTEGLFPGDIGVMGFQD